MIEPEAQRIYTVFPRAIENFSPLKAAFKHQNFPSQKPEDDVDMNWMGKDRGCTNVTSTLKCEIWFDLV